MRAVVDARGVIERFVRWGLVLALLVTVGAPLAAAQEAPPEPDARELSARQMFAVGKYREALEIYGKLFAETGHPTYLRNIGRCYQNLGEADKAISSFHEYLRQAKDLPADQRTLVEGYIREMEELKRKQESEQRTNGDARGAEPSVQPATPSSSPSAVVSATSGTEAARPSRLPAFIVAGASALALGVGTYFGLSALANKRAADPLCPNDKCTTMDGWNKNEAALRDALITDIALGVGVVGAGVATYLFFRSSRTGGAQPEPAAWLRVRPALAPGLAAVSAEARW
jgi:tetratricopeptide (TPR) repeat protein